MKSPFVLVVGNILVLSNGECDLHLQEHPVVDKLLRLGDVESFEYGISDLVGIGHEFLGTVLFFSFLLILVSQIIFFISWLCVHELFPS